MGCMEHAATCSEQQHAGNQANARSSLAAQLGLSALPRSLACHKCRHIGASQTLHRPTAAS